MVTAFDVAKGQRFAQARGACRRYVGASKPESIERTASDEWRNGVVADVAVTQVERVQFWQTTKVREAGGRNACTPELEGRVPTARD